MQLPAQMDSSRSEFITALFIDALFSFLVRFRLLQSFIICMYLYISFSYHQIVMNSRSGVIILFIFQSGTRYQEKYANISALQLLQTKALEDLTDTLAHSHI